MKIIDFNKQNEQQKATSIKMSDLKDIEVEDVSFQKIRGSVLKSDWYRKLHNVELLQPGSNMCGRMRTYAKLDIDTDVLQVATRMLFDEIKKAMDKGERGFFDFEDAMLNHYCTKKQTDNQELVMLLMNHYSVLIIAGPVAVQTQEGLKTKDIRSGAPELVGAWHEILNFYGYTDDIIEKIFIK